MALILSEESNDRLVDSYYTKTVLTPEGTPVVDAIFYGEVGRDGTMQTPPGARCSQ